MKKPQWNENCSRHQKLAQPPPLFARLLHNPPADIIEVAQRDWLGPRSQQRVAPQEFRCVRVDALLAAFQRSLRQK